MQRVKVEEQKGESMHGVTANMGAGPGFRLLCSDILLRRGEEEMDDYGFIRNFR